MARYAQGPWDLSGLSAGPKSRKFAAQVRGLERKSRAFAGKKRSLSPSISVPKFLGLLSDLEGVTDMAGRAVGYASLAYAADTQSDGATSLLTRMSKLRSEVSNRMLFFDLWWKGIDGKNAKRLMAGSGELAGYLAHKRLLGRYALSEPEERVINTLDVTGASALVKLYDKITNSFSYRVGRGTKRLTREELTNLVRSPSSATRRAAYRALLSKYEGNSGVTGEIYQNLVLNWRSEADMRGHGSPISVRNLENDVDDRTVSSLLSVCKSKAGVFQRFFALKAKMIGTTKLRRYDLYAPTPKSREGRYTYDRAVREVLGAMAQFSPEMESHAKAVFDACHVDSEVRAGKRDGAFCSTPTPGLEPYVLVNYTGRSRDVFTLAHELGHAVHSQAARGRSILVQEASLPLAETASTFSELLLYDKMSGTAGDAQRKSMLAEKIDDLYATIMRQSYFTLFEVDAHALVAKGTTVGGLSKAYLANLRGQFGGAVDVSADFGIEWSCIPHFYHAPFYCYAYAFGNLLALSLFARYKEEGRGFAPAYMGILSAGGSIKPEALLSEYGIDIGSAKFWRAGFGYVERQIRELSRLC